MNRPIRHALYGLPPEGLTSHDPDAVQVSPLVPRAARLEDIEPSSLEGLTMLAPPGVLERRYAVAAGLRALAPQAPFTILAPKDRGGSRLARELAAFGCTVTDDPKRHHRIVSGDRPSDLTGIDAAIQEGGPQRIPPDGLWSQPGIFSWDRLDPGSAELIKALPPQAGHGADFGCGIGVLALAVLNAPKVKSLALIDIDRRAIETAQHNVTDPRAKFLWADLREAAAAPTRLDFVVMNPPFHDGGAEDRALGQTFLRRAAESLRTGGRLWLTANRHLPYEGVMAPLFRSVTPVVEANGYKVYEAVR